MQFKTNITQVMRKLPFFVALCLATVLTSCGSFQYVGYDNDGIYGAQEDTPQENVPQENVVTTSTNDSNYYKNYFAENAAEVNAITEESEIFTDIDSYAGNYNEQANNTQEQQAPYGGWGQNNETVNINIIDNGWMGWNDPWLWNGGFGWGLGWNNWGWGRPWGWNRWGWNAGWGWNNGFGWGPGWNNWGWNNGWGPGWNNWGWNNGFINQSRFAFANGRRGSLLRSNNLSRLGRSNAAISRRDYSTSRVSNASRFSRNTNVRSSRSSRNSRVTRPSRTVRNSSSRTTRSNTGVSRSSRSSRSSGSVRSSRSSRSSGVRSSRSGGSRSSGGRSSGGRRGGR